MMNDSKSKKTVKGFTIVEMVVVMAIIGILLGILTPSLLTYYRNSRLKSANADAKMIYNAVQTEIMKYMNMDRVNTEQSGFAGSVWMGYQPGSGNGFSTDSSTPSSLTAIASAEEDKKTTAGACNTVINNVNHAVSGASDVCWAVYVNNYIVKAGVSSAQATSKYVGYYSANKQQASDRASASYQNTYLATLYSVQGNYPDPKGNPDSNNSSATGKQ